MKAGVRRLEGGKRRKCRKLWATHRELLVVGRRGVSSRKGVVMFLGLEFKKRELEKKGIVKGAAGNREGLAGTVRTAEKVKAWRRVVVNRWQVTVVRRKWAASFRIHEREGEKWDLRIALKNQNVGLFTLLKFIFKTFNPF